MSSSKYFRKSSLISFRVIAEVISTEATTDNARTALYFEAINFPRFSICLFKKPKVSLGFTVTILMRIGSNTIENNQAAITPAAVIFPRSWKGGESEKFRDKKPTAVVIEVRNIGFPFTLKL